MRRGGSAPKPVPTARGRYEQLVDCSSIASYGSLALDASLPLEDVSGIAQHIRTCRDCANYVDQMATTAALLGARHGASAGTSVRGFADSSAADDDQSQALGQSQRVLMRLARAADAAHADDLVQETWDHFLTGSPSTIPGREELAAYLLQHVRDHAREEDAAADMWADSLVKHHPHNPADLAESELPADPGSLGSLRDLADLDALDPDSDQAELLFPDLYDDGPDQGEWTSPPAAWPSVTRILGPDAEAETAELYSVVDAALDELPEELGDLLYLVDIEGHSLQKAGVLLQREPSGLQRDLARARNHVRGRVNDYLIGRSTAPVP
jgi:DNA-directed RNA polymerase specialized sigma24 family protein